MANKRLILAVAGSGKTSYLIDSFNLEDRFLVITYTNTSLNLIKTRIIRKYGYLPRNINAQTYFEFLYGFCVLPFVLFKYNLKGIYWEAPPEFTTFLNYSNISKYLTKRGYLYHNRIGKFLEFEKIIPEIITRLEKFYDHFFFDEFQDLGGHDFNFITEIVKANINFLFVGDYYQNTYVTSYDGNINGTLYSNLDDYCKKIKACKIIIDSSTLNNSFRCSPTICSFVRENLGIDIHSNREDSTKISYIRDKALALSIIADNNVIKLVYDKSFKRAYRSKNWGDCKGEDDYNDTCIILNKTSTKLYLSNKLNEIAPRTKNKLYVALTRTRGNCYLIDETLFE